MADVAESLVIAVELALAEADRQFEAFKKKVETPLRVTFADGTTATSGTAVATARTFDGRSVVTGPLNNAPATGVNAAQRGAGLQEQTQAAFVARTVGGSASIGGSGFGPPARPNSTAAVNTVYGNVAAGVPIVPVASRVAPVAGTPVPIVPAGPTIGPRSPARMSDAESAAWATQQREESAAWRARMSESIRSGTFASPARGEEPNPLTQFRDDMRSQIGDLRTRTQDMMDAPGVVPSGRGARGRRSFFRESLNPALGALRTLGGIYGGIQIANAGLGAANQAERADAEAMGDPYSLARNAIDNDFGTNFARAIPLVGDLGANLSEFFTGDQSAATRTLNEARIGDRLAAFRLQRGLSVGQSNVDLATSRASLGNAFAAQQVATQGQLDTLDARRRAQFQAESEPLQAAVRAASANEASVRESFSPATALGQVRNALDSGFDGGIPEATVNAAIGSASQATQNARAAMAASQRRFDAETDTQRGTLQNQLRLLGQTDADRGRTIRTGRELSESAANQSLSGNRLLGQLQSIDAQFAPRIEELSAAISRADALGVPVPREALEGLSAARSEQTLARRFAGRGRLDELGDITGGFFERAGALNFDPFGGRERGIAARYGGRLAGLDRDSEDATILRGQRDQELAMSRQDNRLGTLDTGTALAAERRSLDRQLARDPIGAAAAGIAGNAEQRMRDIARSGVGVSTVQVPGRFGSIGVTDRSGNDALVAAARANSLSELDVLRNDYGRAFVAQQFDLRNVAIDGQRNGQDPSAVFGRIAEDRARIAGSDANAGRDAPGTGANAPAGKLDKETTDAIGRAVAAAIESVLTK